jgi:hypothetical protein
LARKCVGFVGKSGQAGEERDGLEAQPDSRGSAREERQTSRGKVSLENKAKIMCTGASSEQVILSYRVQARKQWSEVRGHRHR